MTYDDTTGKTYSSNRTTIQKSQTTFPTGFAVYQTQFMGATVKSFSSKIGWGTDSSEVSVDLIEDKCAGTRRIYDSLGNVKIENNITDLFIPQSIGTACYFYFGSFRLGGILQNWESNVSAGGSSYSLRIQSPAMVLSNSQIILEGLDDFIPFRITQTFGTGQNQSQIESANLINLPYEHYLRVDKTLASWCNNLGPMWSDIYTVLNGAYFVYKGSTYKLMFETGFNEAMPGDLRYTGDTIDVLSAIDKVAKTASKKIYLDMIRATDTKTNQNINYIVVRMQDFSSKLSNTAQNVDNPGTSRNISAATRLAKGAIHNMITGTEYFQPISFGNQTDGYTEIPFQSCGKIIDIKRGLEGSDNVTHSLLNGDFLQDIWQVEGLNATTSPGTGSQKGYSIPAKPSTTDEAPEVSDTEPIITNAGIINYWGRNTFNGNPMLSQGGSDGSLYGTDYEYFESYIGDQVFYNRLAGTYENTAEKESGPDGEDLPTKKGNLLSDGTYKITMLELKAAIEGYDSWHEFMTIFKKQHYNAIIGNVKGANSKTGMGGTVRVGKKDESSYILGASLYSVLSSKPGDIASAWRECVNAKETKLRVEKAFGLTGDDYLHALHDFVSGYGECYGQKYYVQMPGLEESCPNNTDITGEPNYAWEQTDSGWCRSAPWPTAGESQYQVLGLKWNQALLSMFKDSSGKLKCFLKYAIFDDILTELSPSYADLSKISGNFFVSGNHLYIEGEINELLREVPQQRPGGTSWGAGAVVNVSGGLRLKPYLSKENPMKNLDNALLLLLMASNSTDETPFTEEMSRSLYATIHKGPGKELKGLSLAASARAPIAVTVPLKSNKFCYGRWRKQGESENVADFSKWEHFATKSDNTTIDGAVYGRAEYERVGNLNPWNFGSVKDMDNAAELLSEVKISNQSVIESGSISFVGTPQDLGVSGLGELLESSGPSITNITMSIGVEGVKTSMSYRTFTRNFGELARHKVEWMERIGQSTQKFQTAFNKRATENFSKGQKLSIALLPSERLSNSSGTKKTIGTRINSSSSMTALFSQGTYRPSPSPSPRPPTSVSLHNLHMGFKNLELDEEDSNNPIYKSQSLVTLDALFRPYVIVDSKEDEEDFPALSIYPSVGPDYLKTSNALGKRGGNIPGDMFKRSEYMICSDSLNPFMKKSKAESMSLGVIEEGVDIHAMTRDKKYPQEGVVPSQEERKELSNVRSLALKTPLVLSGWGFDTDGYPVPQKMEGSKPAEYKEDPDGKEKDGFRKGEFEDDWLSRPESWKTGPLDVRWDETLGMWTSPASDMQIVLFRINSTATQDWEAEDRDSKPIDSTNYSGKDDFFPAPEKTLELSNGGKDRDWDNHAFKGVYKATIQQVVFGNANLRCPIPFFPSGSPRPSPDPMANCLPEPDRQNSPVILVEDAFGFYGGVYKDTGNSKEAQPYGIVDKVYGDSDRIEYGYAVFSHYHTGESGTEFQGNDVGDILEGYPVYTIIEMCPGCGAPPIPSPSAASDISCYTASNLIDAMWVGRNKDNAYLNENNLVKYAALESSEDEKKSQFGEGTSPGAGYPTVLGFDENGCLKFYRMDMCNDPSYVPYAAFEADIQSRAGVDYQLPFLSELSKLADLSGDD